MIHQPCQKWAPLTLICVKMGGWERLACTGASADPSARRIRIEVEA